MVCPRSSTIRHTVDRTIEIPKPQSGELLTTILWTAAESNNGALGKRIAAVD
jgi:hypothetical protein